MPHVRWPLAALALCAACAPAEPEPAASADDDDAAAPPVELTDALCEDASLMAELADALGEGGESPSYGELNPEQMQRMATDPTAGPFYMVNLIRYRELAVYPDGRETDLTGREANDLYSPIEFLDAIGARVAFTGAVSGTTWGEAGTWDDVAIVEYPCPLALFAMSAHPEFQERSIHKDAGLEASIVMVTHALDLPDLEPTDDPFPSTAEDPAFHSVHVLGLRDQAEYPADSGEPARTREEALAEYALQATGAQLRFGVQPATRLAVQGVFIGDGRAFHAVWIDRVPSRAAADALAADPDFAAAQVHLEAAVADGWGLDVDALIVDLPTDGEAPGDPALPVAPNGTGTPCDDDTPCAGDGFVCVSEPGQPGFCTPQGCSAGECEAPYVCCGDCNPDLSALLPFEGSACFPEAGTAQLESAAGCTCE